MDINAMTLEEIQSTLLEKAVILQALKAQRAAMEPKLRSLMRETIVLRARGRMDEAGKMRDASHVQSEKMNAIREQEKELEELVDQLKERKKELEG